MEYWIGFCNFVKWLYPTVRGGLELLYFLSAPFVAVAAIAAVYQLRLTRKQAETAAEQLAVVREDIAVREYRENARAAYDACTILLNELTAPFDRLVQTIALEDIAIQTQPVRELDRESAVGFLPVSDREKWDVFARTADATEFLNRLEIVSFSIYARVADDDLAFQLIGTTFCEMVHQLSPAVTLEEPGRRSIFTIRLYNNWQPRLVGKEIEKTIEGLLAQVDTLRRIKDTPSARPSRQEGEE